MSEEQVLEIKEISVTRNGQPVRVFAEFKKSLLVLLDVTVTTEDDVRLGRAIINDKNAADDIIFIVPIDKYLDKTCWIRIIVHHPKLKQYDFKLGIEQDGHRLAEFAFQGELDVSTFMYAGFRMES
ncbi:conserved hypothetical protein [Acinetobacter proteolyticus]|uniref:Uncharacterized protein n=1 Tax=Acinetobacter proteolyticus TaxID=1776741 RepID=A0A653K900_9GAMM|nr:hypothetical protein [Acinetobacter proteolyticus]VXA57455.1 conserved hypothetical protein [Acinetobacter proteolyticus]